MRALREINYRWPSMFVLLASALPALIACSAGPGMTSRAHTARAQTMFVERCKKSGELIHRTVDNVEGIFLMKIRPRGINYGQSAEEQFRRDDPYGIDSTGDGYVKMFLSAAYPDRSGQLVGYRYVEAIDPLTDERYRYTGSVREYVVKTDPLYGPVNTFKTTGFVLDRVRSFDPAPRYGVTYSDISTREEREHWIAGSSLRVIDLHANEVIAERVGYMIDRGQGANGGGRSPWLLALDSACPAFPKDPGGHSVAAEQTRRFVVKVLRPIESN